MPILTDKETVQLQPATGLVRQYAPQIPEMDLRGMRQYGQALEQVGDDLMSHSAKAIATEEAQRAPIAKDAEGNYIRPPALPFWGAKATEVYDGIVNEKFKQTVYRDAEAKLRDIAAENQFDPDKAEREMKAHIGGVLKGTDGRFVGELAPLLERDASQHLYTIKTDFFRRDRAATVQFFKEDRERSLGLAIDAGAAGNIPEQERHLANASKSTGALVGFQAESPLGAQAELARHNSVRTSSAVMQLMKQRIEDGTLEPDDVTDAMRILQGVAGVHENMAGITQATLDALPDKETRNGLVAQLGKLHTLAQASWARRREAIVLEQLDNQFAAGQRGKPAAIPQAKFDEWLGQKAQAAGIDLRTVEGVNWAWQQYGAVSKSALDERFAGAPSAGHAELTAMLPVYNKLSTMQDSDGQPGKQLEHLSADTIRFMENWKHASANNPNDPASAIKSARLGYEAGLNLHPQSEEVAKFVQRRWKSKEHSDWNNKDRISAELTKARFDDLTQKNVDQILLSVGQIAAGDVPIKDAVKLAVQQFEARNSRMPFDGKVGLRPVEEQVPLVADPRQAGKQTADYLKPYIANLFTEKDAKGQPLVFDKAGGVKIENPELGKNIALEPSGFRGKVATFQVVFKPNGMGDHTSYPVTQPNGQPIIIAPEKPLANGQTARSIQDAENIKARINELRRGPSETILDPMTGQRMTVPGPLIGTPPRPAPEVVGIDPMTGEALTKPDLTAAARGPVSARDILVDASIPAFTQGPMVVGKPKVPRYGLSARMDEVPPIFGAPPPPNATKVHEDTNTFYELHSFLREGKLARSVGNLDLGFGRQLAAMIRDMPQEIRTGFTLSSGFRTGPEQAAIHAKSPPGMAAEEGHSQHEFGHAFDLKMTGATEAWVHQNAGKYGLHFPLMGQRKGIPYEPWHIEPIGARGKRAELGPDSPFSDDYS